MSDSNRSKWHLWLKNLGILIALLWHEYMFQRIFPNVSQLYCGTTHSSYLFRLRVTALSQQGQESIHASCHLTFSAVVFIRFWFGLLILFEKNLAKLSQETMSLVFLRLLGIKALTGERWHLFIINILFFRLLFPGLLTKCPEARPSNYLNINKMLVSWLRLHLPRFHSDYWFIGGCNFLSAEDCNRVVTPPMVRQTEQLK